MLHRFEVVYRTADLDSRSRFFSRKLGTNVRCVDVYWIKTESLTSENVMSAAKEILLDPILHLPVLDSPLEGAAFERRYHPGMTDNRSRTLKEAFHLFFPEVRDLEILSGEVLLFDEAVNLDAIEVELKKSWFNPWIHTLTQYSSGEFKKNTRFKPESIRPYFKEINPEAPPVAEVLLKGLSDAELQSLSEKKLLALSLPEMRVIQKHFADLGRNPTDVEIEIIAQTWSEHCKHKIFAAEVTYQDSVTPEAKFIPTQFQSLFKTTIANTTQENPKPWLLSVFKDNAGIVAMSDQDAVCLKVETHNSPSALDPFGGAITGIVGVNRDILGTGIGARPIFNTNVFCVGPSRYQGSLPEKMHHPKDLLEGVRTGVEDGGNQSGIPTINGAVYFDESYMGKPLIFVGSGGYMPRKVAERPIEEKKAFSGDVIFMVGGRIGKDGIHGATFSSLELNDQMPSSVVQLGDPITQKRMTDFLLRARDAGLIQALTDNGAGGLSSSVGEIANLTGGATIELAHAKLKYPGMAAWERVVSESQERMTVVVRPQNVKEFESLAALYEVEISNIGQMNDSSNFEVLFNGKSVSKLSLSFLHDQCPKLQLKATWSGAGLKRSFQLPTATATVKTNSIPEKLLQKMGSPNIASKEWIIRQYDHEVQGCSVIKPLQAQASPAARCSPNDAGVQRIKVDSDIGVVISCGLAPEWSLIDPYLMAQLAVDEAVRNALCVGAEFSTENPEAVFSLVDNFCWPDPTKDTEMMGALVRTCFGLRHAAMELKLPFISGKDSMKNDFRGKWDGKPVHISVLPTLLVSAMARIKNVAHARSSEFKDAGDVIYIIGPSERLYQPRPNWAMAKKIYNWLGSERSTLLKSLHDCSDGGMLVALAECGFARNLGAELTLNHSKLDSEEFCFGEGFHRFIGTVALEHQEKLEREWTEKGIPFQRLGSVSPWPKISKQAGTPWSVDLDTIYEAWKNGARS